MYEVFIPSHHLPTVTMMQLMFQFAMAFLSSPFTVLQYAELKPVPCLTYSDAQKLRELSATPILRQMIHDTTELNISEALEPYQSKVTEDGQYCLVPVFEAKALQLSYFEKKTGEILGIPYIGRRLLLSPTNRNDKMENLSDLRDRLILMEDMAEFKKLFIFFSCATLLAPTSKLDGSHELWCTLLAGDFDINVNWGQFVLDTLVAGIRHFRLGKGSWFTGCLIFLQLFYVNKFYIPTMLVPRTIPKCAAWTDDLMKKRVHAELHDYGDFGLADVQEDEREENAHEEPGNPVNEVEEETTDEIIAEYNAAERQIHQLLRTMRGAIGKLAKRQNTNKTPSSSHQSRSHNQPDINDSFPSPPHVEDEVQMNAIIPYETGHPPIRSYRLRRHATALQSPYVVQPSIKFSASSSVAKQVLAYALDDTRDESQILCSMHNFFLTRFDLKCLGPDKLVEKKVVTMHCRILNGMDKENRKHFLSPNFVSDVEKKRGSLSPKYICDNLWKYFKNTRLCTYEQVNVLSTVIGIQERRPSVDMTEFEFVVPEVVQQLNPTDCGIFVMKFMQLWSNGGISRAIANDKVIKYREKLLTQLIMSPENEVRENVYQAMDQ
ncbi:hypothetical protein CK203_042352 [Vitis vinifera]|uniref:Ubiquitin-like protease family profile domain-containing protein n=1 Tax=Vitis vinifera TaxID=29760 RepID=A0A438H5H0_VITVI|nr:hypothetical protein CK203_042352 [Vitis vinifera]